MATWGGQGVPASDVSHPLGRVHLPAVYKFLGMFSRRWRHAIGRYRDFSPLLNLSSAIWEQELKAIILLALLCIILLLNFCILKVAAYKLRVMI